MSETQRSIAEALRRAYDSPESCPPPGAFLAEEMAALDTQTRTALESHAESCPACGAERDLARTFESSDAMTAGESREVDRIVRRLERAAPGRKSGLARLFRFPTVGGLARSPGFRMAAAAALVVVVGFAVQTTRSGPPSLPDTVVETVVRGGDLAVVSPVGEIEAMTDELIWKPVEGASVYHVTLNAVDDTVLWEATGAQASVQLPEAVRAQLHRAVTYVWKVEALDADEVVVAGSGSVEFRVRPAPAKD